MLVGCHGVLESPSEDACRKEEDVIRLGKQLYLDNQKEFVRVLSEELGRIRGSSSYNYLAVLVATLSRDKRLVPPLEKTAQVEIDQGIRNRYAAAALQKLQKGKCSPPLSKQPEYEELCGYEDTDFNRLRHYPQGK